MSNVPLPSDNLITTAYRSYLVRLWQSDEQGNWRASAQCVLTNNTILFETVEGLLAFLDNETQAQHHQSQAVEETGSGDDQQTNNHEQA